MSFSCSYCNVNFTNKKGYDQHIMSNKHKDNIDLSKKIYTCIPCNMRTSSHYNYTRHLTTQKHLSNTEETSSTTCTSCGKTYKTKTGILKHKKLCTTQVIEKVKQDPNLIMYVMEQMSKQNETIQKQCETIQSYGEQMTKQNETIQKQQDAMNALISKVGNTTIDNSIHKTQKTFNLNLFLNEECKDAINWSDFIKNITVTLDDIDMTSNITDRVSYTICKELDNLGVYKRPIHCTDIKRHKACIKEGDEWKKEQDPLMKQGVTRISGKYQQIMNNWGSKHPMWHEDQELSEKMMSMMNIYMREPSEDKCISTILKHTTLKHIS